MKGISLSIEVVVIITIGVVIIATLLFFLGDFFGKSSKDLEREKALQIGCQILVAEERCDIAAWDSITVPFAEYGEAAGTETSLRDLCNNAGFISEESCK